MVQAAQDMAQARSPSPPPAHRKSFKSHSRPRLAHDETESAVVLDHETTESPISTPHEVDHQHGDERTPLLHVASSSSSTESVPHSLPEGVISHGGGHAHGSMNMHALLLHVFGDALGNVGVIATGLIIWLTTWSFKYYFDPIISLVITVIIFSSALPLGESAKHHRISFTVTD